MKRVNQSGSAGFHVLRLSGRRPFRGVAIIMKILPILLLASVAAFSTQLVAQAQGAPFTIEESGEGFARLADAVAAIGDADATILIAPGTYRDCAVQAGGRIAYRATTAGKAVFDGGVCEGKATLVLRGADAMVEGLVFQGQRVADGNGAGIRLEAGGLDVRDTIFRDAESGILAGDDAGGAIRIDRSTFTGLGRCDRGLDCAHSIYIGRYGSLSVTRSRFERGTGGHYVKSRAPRIAVTNSSFDDSAGRTTNYMIDLPAGATGEVTGNTFVQGEDKENYSAFVAVAAEARDNRSAGLKVTGNKASLAPGVDRRTTFVADWSGEPITLAGNVLGTGLKPFEVR